MTLSSYRANLALRIRDDDGMITNHFSWQEAFHTNHRSIDNSPNDEDFDNVVQNIGRTAIKLEKVRAILNKPIIVSSWYRSPELNAAVGGAAKSDHMSGCAVDFICPTYGTPAQIAKKLSDYAYMVGFKQLILEHGWVHISWDAIPGTNPKLQVLSLLTGGRYANGLTDKHGNALT